MIKAIIFDLGGVLFTNGTKKFIDDISTQYNLDQETVEEIMDGETGSKYRESKITRDEFWKQILEKLQIKVYIKELENQWISGYELIEGTRDLIFELSKKYRVFFLSDNVQERVERINKKYGFINWFSGGVFSHEAGVRKPDPRIYTMTLEKTGVKPEEAVFIDDKAELLEPASQLGMTTFLFESPEKLRSDLAQKGIL
ncbi:MAG TPA: HAD family phosphatase [Candidatus Limnocylindrales bacterium]|nr:HAD family phosphatase [Candidatus Limnocylindrales bacterium]